MKKNNKEVTKKRRFGHFMKHYFGYLLLAFCCAIVTMVLVGISM